MFWVCLYSRDAEMWIGLHIPAGDTNFIWADGTSTTSQAIFIANTFLAGIYYIQLHALLF